MDIVLVKLGGSLITEKSLRETSRPSVIARLAGEIARAAGRMPERISERLILGHGSGSFGHVAASEHGVAGGLRSPAQLPGVSLTQERAASLHREVAAALVVAGLAPFSIAPSSCLVAEAGQPAAFAAEPLVLALRNGLLPVVYGDVVMDRQQGVAICSTERVMEALAGSLSGAASGGLRIRRALWLGETDGVYDGEGRTIPLLTEASFGEAEGALRGAAGTDVTGGIRHRVETALALARLGIPSLVLNGLTPGHLERALLGEPVFGTEIR